MCAEAEFELDAGAPAVSARAAARRETVSTYQHKLEHYAAQFGRSLRAIKGYKAAGAKVGDLPPFDDIAAMADWWERMQERGVFRWKVPDVFALAKKSPGPPGDASPDHAEKVRRASEKAEEEDLGFAAALERVQRAERLAHSRWQEELAKVGAEFDPVAEKRRAEAWERTAEKLATLESKAEKILGREFASMDEVEEIVSSQFAAFRDAMRSFSTRVATKVNLPPEWFDRVVEAGDAELDKIFATIGEGERFELEA